MKLPEELRLSFELRGIGEKALCEAIVRDCAKNGKLLIESYTQDQEFADNWEVDQLARYGLEPRHD